MRMNVSQDPDGVAWLHTELLQIFPREALLIKTTRTQVLIGMYMYGATIY